MFDRRKRPSLNLLPVTFAARCGLGLLAGRRTGHETPTPVACSPKYSIDRPPARRQFYGRYETPAPTRRPTEPPSCPVE